MRTLLLTALLCFCFTLPVHAQINAALGKPVTTANSTSTNGNTWAAAQAASMITDGNLGTFSHPATMAVTLGFKYDINLGRAYVLERLRIYNRNDGCCPERLSNYRVQILDDSILVAGHEQGDIDLRFELSPVETQ